MSDRAVLRERSLRPAFTPPCRGGGSFPPRYEHVELPALRGAVNDAHDIAYALAAAGSDDIVVLEDAAATREHITAEWRALLARSRPGDTAVLTFAGHGGQEPARLPAHEPDGFDEVLLLSAFTSTEPGRLERIVDDELAVWFVEAGERELRVIFVADTSHSGGLHPDLDPYASSSESETPTSVPRAVELARPAQYTRPAHSKFLGRPAQTRCSSAERNISRGGSPPCRFSRCNPGA